LNQPSQRKACGGGFNEFLGKMEIHERADAQIVTPPACTESLSDEGAIVAAFRGRDLTRGAGHGEECESEGENHHEFAHCVFILIVLWSISSNT
jgi:hypothetical protein